MSTKQKPKLTKTVVSVFTKINKLFIYIYFIYLFFKPKLKLRFRDAENRKPNRFSNFQTVASLIYIIITSEAAKRVKKS